MKIYYENILANHNYIAKPNIAWVADITEFDLGIAKSSEIQKSKKLIEVYCWDNV